MRSTDFKSGQYSIKVLNDIKPTKKKVNWDRSIYLVILGLFLSYILFLIVKSLLLVQGDGQVLFKKLDIQYTEDIQISKILVNEGDAVNIGDTLFSFKLNHIKSTPSITPEINHQVIKIDQPDLSWLEREASKTKMDIDLQLLEIESKRKVLNKVLKDIQKTKEAILLNIYTAEKLDNLTTRQVQLESEIINEQGEIYLLQDHLEELKNRLYAIQTVANEDLYKDYQNYIKPVEEPQESFYISPEKGTITKINKENYEVAIKSDIIMSIHKPANIFIKVFYDQKSLKHVNAGDKVLVVFPDGTLSEGILERFYFATYQLPDELQKKYEPITRSIAADIYPVNNSELEKWKAFYKLNVHVYKWKFW